MTGQVDEAGRETAAQMAERLAEWCDRNGAYITTAELRAVAGAFTAEVAGLRTRNEELERVYVLASDRADRLAGQVAAIRALHGKVPEPFLDGERYSCSTCTDGEGNAIDWPCPTLVASSPTTP